MRGTCGIIRIINRGGQLIVYIDVFRVNIIINWSRQLIICIDIIKIYIINWNRQLISYIHASIIKVYIIYRGRQFISQININANYFTLFINRRQARLFVCFLIYSIFRSTTEKLVDMARNVNKTSIAQTFGLFFFLKTSATLLLKIRQGRLNLRRIKSWCSDPFLFFFLTHSICRQCLANQGLKGIKFFNYRKENCLFFIQTHGCFYYFFQTLKKQMQQLEGITMSAALVDFYICPQSPNPLQ